MIPVSTRMADFCTSPSGSHAPRSVPCQMTSLLLSGCSRTSAVPFFTDSLTLGTALFRRWLWRLPCLFRPYPAGNCSMLQWYCGRSRHRLRLWSGALHRPHRIPLYKNATNANTLNIELCDVVKNGKYDVTEKTLENAIELTRSYMQKYNIPIDRVIRHFDVTGKHCPAYYMDPAAWDAVKARITNETDSPETAVSGCAYNGIDYSLLFSAKYYSDRYADLKAAFGYNETLLFNHFITCGMAEGRQAIESFNVQVYKSRYPDLQKAFDEKLPLYYQHYIQFGINEKRSAL